MVARSRLLPLAHPIYVNAGARFAVDDTPNTGTLLQSEASVDDGLPVQMMGSDTNRVPSWEGTRFHAFRD